MSDTMSYRWLIIPRKGAWGVRLSLALLFNTSFRDELVIQLILKKIIIR